MNQLYNKNLLIKLLYSYKMQLKDFADNSYYIFPQKVAS